MKYLINGIIFDAEQRTLTDHTQVIQLEAKSYALLMVFVTHPEQVLSRDRLIELVWHGSVVSDGAVNKAISKLRHHFVQLKPEAADIIITKPKFGYVLNCAVQVYEHKPNRRYLTSKVYLAALLLLTLAVLLFVFLMPRPNTSASLVNIERVTALDGIETMISASRSAELLFFSSTSSQSPPRLILKSLDDGHTQPISTDPDSTVFASLSPSGDDIVWIEQDPLRCQIKRYHIATAKPHVIYDCSALQNIKLSWQNDEQALFIRARDNNASPYVIYKLMIATSAMQQLTLPLQHAHMKGDFLLAAHPSKPLLAFVRYIESSLSEIHIVDSNSLKTLAVHTIDHTLNAIAWSTEQDTLFIANHKALYRLAADTGAKQHIKQLSYPIESIAVTKREPNQQVVLISQYHASSKIQAYNLKDSNTKTLFSNAALNRLPRSKSEDVFFISDMDDQHTLWQYQNEQLSKLDMPFEFGFTRYDIAPTENKLIFEKLGAVYEYDISNAQLHTLFTTSHQAYAPSYAHSTNTVLYSSNKSGQWQLWLYDKKQQTHRQVTKKGGYSGYFYDETLYFSKRDQAGLWKLAAGEEQLVLSDFSNINWLNWQILNKHVYFYRKGSGIWQYNLHTQTQKHIMTEPEGFLHQYHVQADEQQIIFAQLQPMQGDIQMLTFE
ncbi:winged helix-turn-helix domain-containing protein [Pseudoalteromonas sp. T1lg23B]|uniref:winged helix-turn-helix domain-containing protein n=1 Tax=Pseudoalteromonas sp. T1lg23B TaxID=2077097 RepID=UPI000CF65D96|nr:winged helix-turn-helix domain-containing protein [Pseudoalteromonas sp. T1lg23B]